MILSELSRFADEIIEPMTLSGMRKRINYPGADNKKLSDNIRSLEKRGYININRNSNSVVLTNKGKIKLIENDKNVKVDGKTRMLSFDIPESIRKKRDQFRYSIKRIGYKQVQKSLWASPFARADQVDIVIKELGLGKYVVYLLVEKTDIEDYLKRLFKNIY